MRLSRAQNDVVTETLTHPDISIFDLLHRVHRHQHTYAESRKAILDMLNERVIVFNHPKQSVFFNRNQGKVWRGID